MGARGGEGRPKTRQQENVTSSLIKLENLNKGSRSCCRERERGGGQREDESRELCPGDVDSGARSC